MMKNYDLSIVIPAYSEAKRIGSSLATLAEFLRTDKFLKNLKVEVLVIAADTSDKTIQIVKGKQPDFKELNLLMPGSRAGKGRDVQYGMLRATGKYIIFMDADLATPLRHIEEFYKICKKGSDVVIGTRNLLIYKQAFLHGVFAHLGNLLYRLGSMSSIEDTQCGFKMFTYEATQSCFSRLRIMGWGFDLEILAIAKANKLKVKSVRLDDWKHMPHSTYNESKSQTSVRVLKDFLYVSFHRITGSYRR